MTSLSGKKVVFTGFRDDVLKEKILASGGLVMTAVSNQTDVVVFDGPKGEASTKAKTARKLGVAVIAKDAFMKKYLQTPAKSKVGFFGKLFDKADKSPPKAAFPKGWPADTIKDPTTFLIHDNGGRPFKVSVSGNFFEIHKCVYTNDACAYTKVVVKKTKFLKVWIGRDKEYGKKFDGNSVLFEVASATKTKHKYMFVGQEIYTIEVADEIKEFASPVYGSDVSYPFGIGAKFSYCFLELVALPNEMIAVKDPYDFLYGYHLGNKLAQAHTKRMQKDYKMARKLVHKRFDDY
jgi:BRCA1 C Terminus (BRCT) domain